jgi:hypothetical protein
MTSENFTLRQILAAAHLPLSARGFADQIVSRGHVELTTQPAKGHQRTFTFREAAQMVAIIELNRLGLPLAQAARCTQHLTLRNDGPAILAVWQGPVGLIPPTERGEPAPKVVRDKFGFTVIPPEVVRSTGGHDTIIQGEIVGPCALPDMVTDPDKWSLMLVNLDRIEAGLKAAAEAEGGDE